MRRIIGIPIDFNENLNADNLAEMSNEELLKVYEESGSEEEYTEEGFWRYLNNDSIDTENYWWLVVTK